MQAWPQCALLPLLGCCVCMMHPWARCRQLWNPCCGNASALLLVIPFLYPDSLGGWLRAVGGVLCVGSLGLWGCWVELSCGCCGVRWAWGKKNKAQAGFFLWGEKCEQATGLSLPAYGCAAPSEGLLGSGKRMRQGENGRWRFSREWWLGNNLTVLKSLSSFFSLEGLLPRLLPLWLSPLKGWMVPRPLSADPKVWVSFSPLSVSSFFFPPTANHQIPMQNIRIMDFSRRTIFYKHNCHHLKSRCRKINNYQEAKLVTVWCTQVLLSKREVKTFGLGGFWRRGLFGCLFLRSHPSGQGAEKLIWISVFLFLHVHTL